jgi:hypothetical protein
LLLSLLMASSSLADVVLFVVVATSTISIHNPITAAVEPVTDRKLLYRFSYCFRYVRGRTIVLSTLLYLNMTPMLP